MGMDVDGIAPTSERGKYFRNNIWWWHGIPDYIADSHPDLYAKCKYWHTNDGDGLQAEDAADLAKRLHADIASGKVAEYAKTYPDAFSVENVQKFADFCAESGGFKIY